jgi:hypothetical protein
VADRVDPGIEAMEAPHPQPALHRSPADNALPQLPQRHDAMLLSRQLGYDPVK